MRFIVLIKATRDSEAGVLPSTEQLMEMGAFNEQAVKDGFLLAAEGLQASSKGARLRSEGGQTTVTDGPFAETKELIAGFAIVQAKSIREVVERLKNGPLHRGGEIEIRQLFDPEDFGENATPEVLAQDDRVFTIRGPES